MLDFNPIPLTPYPEFNWAFTCVIVFVLPLITVKGCIRVLTRS